MNPRPLFRTVTIGDDPTVTRLITARRDPWAGVAVARVAPDSRSEHQLLCDLLEGLNKDLLVSGWRRDVDAERDSLTVFLAAHPINHLVIVDAQHLTADGLALVAEIVTVAGTTTWLCEEEPTDTYLTARDLWPSRPADIDELLAALPEPTTATVAPRFPDVVPDGPFTFLAACRDRLDPDAFQVVADRFIAARDQALGWAEQVGTLDEDAVVEWLRDQLYACPTGAEMLTVVRAAQVAFFITGPTGWWVQVEPYQLIATGAVTPEATAADPQTWRDLAAYREPARAAACALVAAGAGADDLVGLRVEQLDADGSGATTDDGHRHQVHPDAAVYLRALRLHRQQEGAHPGAAAFTYTNGRPVPWRTFARHVRAAALDLGRNLSSGSVTKARPNTARWATRYGVSVAAL